MAFAQNFFKYMAFEPPEPDHRSTRPARLLVNPNNENAEPGERHRGMIEK
jgi:hypothetical protein